jgi:hypothetical protein
MLLLKNKNLVLTIPLASQYLSTISIRFAFLIFLSGVLLSEILGGLFQTTLLTLDKSGPGPALAGPGILNLDLFLSMSLLPIVLYNSP